MGFDDPTRGDSRTTRPDDPVSVAKERFLERLDAGSKPRIEDYLEGHALPTRRMILRTLILAERDWNRDHGLVVDPKVYFDRFSSETKLIDDVLGIHDPSVTISLRNRGEAEIGLLFGLLSLANGLITPKNLTQALEVWASSPDRTLHEILVERGHIDEAVASMVAALASKHMQQHHGLAWESLIALGNAVRFRLDPREIADSELRAILTGFIAESNDQTPPLGSQEIGTRYEILKPHAKGGLGVVSLARDREIHREVALKEIREDRADDPDYRARFLREAEVTGRLEHPGIVPVYGMGHHDDGRPYYIMRFIRGETLRAAIKRLHEPFGEVELTGNGEPVDLHALVGRFIDACHAVSYAHHRKILHRDIKPINIMLGPFGETLVVDWGLAKSFDGFRSGEQPILDEEGSLRPESGSGMTPTRYGSEIGTPGYMSPEQAAGRLTELGPPSDIYSLGVTLYYLVAGHAPFEGAGREEFLKRVREGDFPRPRTVNPTVPPALEAICLKAMALRPVDRYQAVIELVDELERWRAGNPVLAYPEPLLDQLGRWAKKHKTPLAVAAVLLVCTTFGLATYAARERQSNLKLLAAREVSNKEHITLEAKGKLLSKSLKMRLSFIESPDLTVLAGSEPIRAGMANQLVTSYRELLQVDPEDKKVQFDLAEACQLAANIERSMGKFDHPRKLFEESARLLESLEGWYSGATDLRLELATLLNDAGENYQMAGKPRGAIDQYRKGLETLLKPSAPGRLTSKDSKIEASLQLDLSTALLSIGEFDLAEEAARRALHLLKPRKDGPPADRSERLVLVSATLELGSIFRLRREFDAASNQLAEAERLARDLLADISDPDTRFAFAALRIEQGLLLIEASPAGSTEAALNAFQEAHSQIKPLCESLPRVIEFQRGLAVTLNGRGSCFLDRKRIEEARADFSAARELLERLDGAIPDHFLHLGQLARTFANLSQTSRAEGKPDALSLLRKAAEINSEALNANPASPVDKRLRLEIQQRMARDAGEDPVIPPCP